MSRFKSRLVLSICGLVLVGAPATAGAQEALTQPPDASSNGTGSLTVTLQVGLGTYTMLGPNPTAAGQSNPQVQVRGIALTESVPAATGLNNLLMGPTLRVRPGETLNVNLVNALAFDPEQGDLEQSSTRPHGFDVINLHTHGLHVSPNSPSDNVLLSIYPVGTPPDILRSHTHHGLTPSNNIVGSYQYSYQIPANHPAGTYWYHAHKHGAVALHLGSGFAGALIITDPKNGIDSLPAVQAAREQILLIQEIQYDGTQAQPYPVTCKSVYPFASCTFVPGQNPPPTPATINTALSVNGQFQPAITMYTGEAQLWRVVNTTIGDVTPMCLVPVGSSPPAAPKMYVLAADGNPIQRPVPSPDLPFELGPPQTAPDPNGLVNNELLFLSPGQRLDLMVQAPSQPGTYALYPAGTGAMSTLCQPNPGSAPVFTVLVLPPPASTAYSLQLPTQTALNGLIAPPPIPAASVPALPTQGAVFGFTAGTFDPQDGGASVINGRVFNPQSVQRDLKLDQVDLWSTQTAADTHMFHIHVNPFALVSRGQISYPFPLWRDTVLINCSSLVGGNNCTFPGGLTTAASNGGYGEVVQFLQQPKDFTGTFVMHCHNVTHEDNGMMELVKVSQ